MSKGQGSITFDAQIEALGHVDRRRLLLALLRANRAGDLPVEIDRLAQTRAEDSFKVSMRHLHLPKLADSGFVKYDLDTYTVTIGPCFDQIGPLLELLHTNRNQLPDDWL